MKKLKALLILLAFVPALIWAAPTPKVLYCASNTTLYFVYDENTYDAGDPFTPAGTDTPLTITAVYTNMVRSNNSDYWGTDRLKYTTVDFQPGFEEYRPNSTAYWFCDFKNLSAINNINRLHTDNVINMKNMFDNCLILPELDVSGFNTAKVTDMSCMFNYCSGLDSLNLSNFDTGKVTDMTRMFKDCTHVKKFTFPDNFGSNATIMIYMFQDCFAVSSFDLTKFNTAKTSNMMYMFYRCYGLTSITFPADFGSNATNMQSMFEDCTSLPSLDLTNLNTAKATTMQYMFKHCDALVSITFPENFGANTSIMSSMFANCQSLPSIDLTNLNTNNATDMNTMFYMCNTLKRLDVSGFYTAKVTNMQYMFSSCNLLASIKVGQNFDIGKVSNTNRQYMFLSSNRLRYIDFSASHDTDAIQAVDRSSEKNMFNGLPETTLIYLPVGATKPTSGNLRNVVYKEGDEWKCDEYYSVDKTIFSSRTIYNDVEVPYAIKTKSATYSRTMPNDIAIYGTTVLPYDFTGDDNVSCYLLNKENPVTMQFVPANEVPAHTPFLFENTSGTQTATFTVTDQNNSYGISVKQTRDTSEEGGPYTSDTPADGWTAKGYFVQQTEANYDGVYYIANNKFWKADGALTLYPHRVTFHGAWIYGANTTAPSFSIAILNNDGEEHVLTGIEAAEVQNAVTGIRAIYDMQGRRIPQMQQGINIVQMEDGSVLKVKK